MAALIRPYTFEEAMSWMASASFEELDWEWNTAPPGDKLFTGELGQNMKDTFYRRKAEYEQSKREAAGTQQGEG